MSHLHSIYDTDKHFVIDPITRNISTESYKLVLTRYDHNSERFTFEIPRYIEGHDMFECNQIKIHADNIGINNIECNSDVHTVDDKRLSPDDENIVIFSWLISRAFTQIVGKLSFSIDFACIAEDGVEEYSWGTNNFDKVSINNRIHNTQKVIEEHSDFIGIMQARYDELVKNGATKEEVGQLSQDVMKHSEFTTEYTPTEDYHLTTKKYVDDKAPLIVTFTGTGTEENPWTCNVTYEEIMTAISVGRSVEYYAENLLYNSDIVAIKAQLIPSNDNWYTCIILRIIDSNWLIGYDADNNIFVEKYQKLVSFDDLSNKPFYEYTDYEVLASIVCESEESSCEVGADFLEKGKTYHVAINTEGDSDGYDVLCSSYVNATYGLFCNYLGDTTPTGLAKNSEYGFIIYKENASDDIYIILDTDRYTLPCEVVISEPVTKVKTLDEKFIPDTIARTEDIPTEMVMYSEQELTEEQQEQVRANIGAASMTEFSALSQEIGDLKENGVVGSSIEPKEDDIPKVFFSEAIPQTKDDVVTGFRYISKTKDVSGYAEFKAQGNSSMNYPKKNVTVKMYANETLEEKLKVDFKNWGEQRKHVYKANWIDLSHARNVVSARIWADVVKSRADYELLPELLRTSPNQGAVDGFPVKVYSQGIYQGRYTLNIPKDAWMANMDDSLDEHCILCGEGYNSGCFRSASMGEWTDEVHDTRPTLITNRWLEVINFVMNSTDEEFKENLGNYFFVDSLIDYFIFGMVQCGLDAFGKNQLYFTYDGVKWIASMYDMDSTWGLYWNGSKFVSASYSREEFEDFVSGRQGNLLYIRLASIFYEEIQSRYEELKQGALSIPNIINHFERFTDIASLDLVKEDYASTTGSGKFTGIPSKDTNNIQQIRKFVVDRYAYCDEYFASLTPEIPVPATGITLDKTILTFTDASTQTITATVEPENTTDTVVWTSNNEEVAKVSNGVVTPIKKGSCTITATVGSVSAVCEVTVDIEEIVTYTITRNLTGCTSDSIITLVNEGHHMSKQSH